MPSGAFEVTRRGNASVRSSASQNVRPGGIALVPVAQAAQQAGVGGRTRAAMGRGGGGASSSAAAGSPLAKAGRPGSPQAKSKARPVMAAPAAPVVPLQHSPNLNCDYVKQPLIAFNGLAFTNCQKIEFAVELLVQQ